MCPESYDGEHEWEAFDAHADPLFPDDEESDITDYCCTLCGATATGAQWEGGPDESTIRRRRQPQRRQEAGR